MVDEREEHFKRTAESIKSLIVKNQSLLFVLRRLKKYSMDKNGNYNHHFRSNNMIANENTYELAQSTYSSCLTILAVNKLIRKEGKAKYFLTPELFYFFENCLDELSLSVSTPQQSTFYPKQSFKFRSKKK